MKKYYLIIVSMLFLFGCTAKNPPRTNNSINHQKYRVLVVPGTPKNILRDNREDNESEILINEVIKINEPFTFITTDKHKAIEGLLSKTPDGKLHFKGSVRVFSTAASYDQEITLLKGYQPQGSSFSSMIHLFYIKFEKI